MKKFFCDVPGCNKEAWERDLDACNGYSTSSWSSFDGKRVEYEPFERPHLKKVDLCEEHFKKWCEATYYSLYENIQDEED